MAYTFLLYSINLARVLALFSTLAAPVQIQKDERNAEATLVRVNIITETRGAKGTVEINGNRVENYSPTIIQDFSSIGIVINDDSDVATFLGYRWMDIQDRNLRVEVTANEGRKLKGRLVGIDQRNGVAVVRLTNGKLNKTPVCTQCEIKDGVTVISPIIESPDLSHYQVARILSVGAVPRIPELSRQTIQVNPPFPEIGQPILTADHRILGFVADQDPVAMSMIVYPVDQMLASAKRILKAGGDIRTGWLGIFLLDGPHADAGIVVQGVEPNSPAQKAGLVAQDLLHKYNGKDIQDARQFIQLVEGTPIGSKAAIDIVRQGKPIKITAMIEARKPQANRNRLALDLSSIFDDSSDDPLDASSQPELRIGLEVTPLTPFLADTVKMPEQKGLLVTKVVKQKPAEKAGVLEGDVIVAMDEYPVVDVPSFVAYWQTHELGAQLVLKVIRKGTERVITIQVPHNR
jgi:S1-C subfamily serine protease